MPLEVQDLLQEHINLMIDDTQREGTSSHAIFIRWEGKTFNVFANIQHWKMRCEDATHCILALLRQIDEDHPTQDEVEGFNFK